jgi:RimJ/RimL family protein N-acetyltransferase
VAAPQADHPATPAALPRLVAEPIHTARLTLLPLRVDHATELAAALSDPALHTFIGGCPATEPQLRSRLARMLAGPPGPAESWLNWVIQVNADGRLAGTVQATAHTAPAGTIAEIAWVVGTPWQRRGIGTAAARALVARLHDRQVHVVTAHIHPEHAASAAVAAAAGLAPTTEIHDGETLWRLALDPPAPQEPQPGTP